MVDQVRSLTAHPLWQFLWPPAAGVALFLLLRGRSFVDQSLIKHEFVKRLHRRYAQEKIAIPFLTQVVIPGL